MTTQEKERLAKLEQKTDNIVEKLDTLIEKFDNLDTKYITRNEFAVFKWITGVIIGLITAVSTYFLTRK